MCICKLHEDTPLIRTHSGIHNYVYNTILCYPSRLACQVNDGQSVSGAPAGLPTSPGEALSKRCVQLVRTSLKPDIWPSKSNVKNSNFLHVYRYFVSLFLSDIDIKIPWFAKLFDALTQTDPTTGNPLANYANICTALDLLTFMLHVLPKLILLAGFKTLSKGLTICMTCGSTKVVRYIHSLLTKLMGMFPTEPSETGLADLLLYTLSYKWCTLYETKV